MIQYDDNFEENYSTFKKKNQWFIKQSNPKYYNFFFNLLHKGNIPGRQEFPELKISQIIDLNLPSICNITSQYGRFTIKILSPDFNSTPTHRIQTYDIELGFSNFF